MKEKQLNSENRVRLCRLERLVGEEKINDLSTKCVAILGCGGVGGYVIEALARSGIGTLILIDYDVIDESNINRQIIALESTVGTTAFYPVQPLTNILPLTAIPALK